MGMVNVCFLRNKILDFVDYVCSINVDIFVIIEIWFNVNDDIIRCVVCFEGYYLVDYFWLIGCGGGIVLFYCDLLVVKKIEVGEKMLFEYLEWLV